MFSAFSSGLSGLVKVAQDTVTTTTSTEENEQIADTQIEDKQKASGDGAELKADAAKDNADKDATQDAATGASDWGSYLFGSVKDVTMKVTNSAANATGVLTSGAQMLKKTMEENTILGEFNREQEKFVEDKKDVEAQQEASLTPWIGYGEDEENLKEQILALSGDERHFLRPPPGGVDYAFDYKASYPVALAMLEADQLLQEMRFRLVPKRIKEEDFWRNYFYRVSLIKQSVALHSMSAAEDEADDVVAATDQSAASGAESKATPEAVAGDGAAPPAEDGEEEIPEWEKELQRELQEYEVVGGSDSMAEGASDNADPSESPEWQEEIQKMLEQDGKE